MNSFNVILGQLLETARENPILLVLTILVLIALVQNFFLFKRLRRLVSGGDGKTLEGTIKKLGERVSALETEALGMSKKAEDMERRLAGSVRGVSVKRFDPFQNAGGQQSFAAALLNEKGDGAVISGIHARDGVRVYAKSLSKFSSERELSSDEKSAIHEAKNNLAQ